MKVNENKILGSIAGKLKGSSGMIHSKQIPNKIAELISGLEQTKSTQEAIEFLESQVQKGQLEKCNGALFKADDYTIQAMLKFYAEPYLNNMQKIDSFNLPSTPNLIRAVEVNNDSTFIISQIPGTKTGNLIPYSQAKHLVSKESKMTAYKDIQELTKSGITDNNIAQGRLWFVAPDDHTIIFPSWEAVRPVDTNEGAGILNGIHKILFQ